MSDKKRPKPAVSALIFNEEGEVLLTLRSKNVRWPGQWCLPGGHLEGGQDWNQALESEVLEEVGVKIGQKKLVGLYSNSANNTFVDEKGETLSYVVASFLVTEFEGEPKPSSEVDEVRWVDPNKLPSPMLKSESEKIADALNFSDKVFVR